MTKQPNYQPQLTRVLWGLHDLKRLIGKQHPFYKDIEKHIIGLAKLRSTINSTTAKTLKEKQS